ncbi:hypothetical protein MHYP_G00183010 [Metynnis hypsauchen]
MQCKGRARRRDRARERQAERGEESSRAASGLRHMMLVFASLHFRALELDLLQFREAGEVQRGAARAMASGL